MRKARFYHVLETRASVLEGTHRARHSAEWRRLCHIREGVGLYGVAILETERAYRDMVLGMLGRLPYKATILP